MRSLDSQAELEEACRLLGDIWGEPAGSEPVSSHLLRALLLSGNYVHGAFAPDQEMVAATVAWAAVGSESDLHSHITGVAPTHHKRGIGLALKLHQREWALERGFASVSWTFDPLVARNATFNLARLGARVDSYMENIYGTMADALNNGDESDRFLVCWELADDPPTATTFLPREEASELLAVGPAGEPVTSPASGARLVTVSVPPDIERLRAEDPGLARAWRTAVRTALAGQLADGGRVVGLSGPGTYLVELGGRS